MPRALVLAALITAPVAAQGQIDLRTSSPEVVAAEVLRADSAGDWKALLRLAHPEALREAQARAVWQLKLFHSPVWDSLRQSFPFESTQARHMEAAMKQQEWHQLHDVFLVASVEALQALPPETVYVRQQRARQTPIPRRVFAARSSPGTILGAVTSGDTLAVVVLWPSAQEDFANVPGLPMRPPPQQPIPRVMTLRRLNGEWRSMLDAPISHMTGISIAPADSS